VVRGWDLAVDLTYEEVLGGDTTTPHSSGCSGRSVAISRGASVPGEQQLSQHIAADALGLTRHNETKRKLGNKKREHAS
jgi:hypothetical protein